MPLEITEASDRHAIPGDLGAGVGNGHLLLPPEVAVVLRSQGIRTAEDLLSYISAFPTSFAHVLRWQTSDVPGAWEKLKSALEWQVRDELFQPPTPGRRRFGARDPKALGAARR